MADTGSSFSESAKAAVEEKLKEQTYGLVTAAEFKARQEALIKEEEERQLAEQNKAEAEALKAALAESAPPPPPPPPAKKAKVAPPKSGALSFSLDDQDA